MSLFRAVRRALGAAAAEFRLLPRRLQERRAASWWRPGPSLVFVKNPDAISLQEKGEMILSFPRQRRGLALNPVAARCWDLMDGRATLRSIARRIAAEHGVTLGTAQEEVASFAGRLRRGWYALPRSAWRYAHTHLGEPFDGPCEPGIVEETIGDTLIVHRAVAAPGPQDDASPAWRRPFAWLAGAGTRRRAAAAFEEHVRRELPLREAAAAFERGWAHSSAGRLAEAELEFQSAARLAPQWANPRYQLGYVYLRTRRYPEAVQALALTERMKPGFFMVREYLGLARQLQAGVLHPEAFLLFDRAASAETSDPDEVIELCRRALAVSPDFASARVVLGRAYARKREYELALVELRRAIREGPDPATLCHALFARGSIFLARGMSEQALWEFEKVIQIDGSPVATRHVMAHLASPGSVH